MGLNITNYLWLFILTIIAHIIGDYFLQGILASMKQKSWWPNQEGYTDKYKYDYIAALISHAFIWSFLIINPYLILYRNSYELSVVIVVIIFNTIIHAYIDDLKANRKILNLIQDQCLHLLQIIATLLILV